MDADPYRDVDWTKVNPLDGPDMQDGPGTVNGAPGVIRWWVPATTGGVRRIREKALSQARKSWKVIKGAPEQHADSIVRIAQVFERYLTTGQAYDPQTVEPDEPVTPTKPTWPGADFPTRPDIAAVIAAAVIWADLAHFVNPLGRENWRHWADEKDEDLINAVAVLTGRPRIDNKEKA